MLADVNADMQIMTEETFGPVIPGAVFDTVEEAVILANSGIYGLSAAVIAGTTDEARTLPHVSMLVRSRSMTAP